MNILMPMAGEGSRLKNLYSLPKPLVPIAEMPMFYWAIQSAGKADNYIFVVQKKHVLEFKIDEVIKSFYPNSAVVVQDGKVNGPVITTLLAKDYIDDSPLLIMDCDMSVNFNYHRIYEETPDIGVVTFSSSSDQYSYLKDDGHVVEKQVVSDSAIAGSFYWSNGSKYIEYAQKAVEDGFMVNGEVYVSSVINKAVDDGLKVTEYKSFEVYDLSTANGSRGFISALHR